MFEIEPSGKIRFTTDAERARRLAALREAMRRDDLAAAGRLRRSDLRFRGRVLYVCDVFQYTADCFAVVTGSAGPLFVTTPVVGLGQAMLTGWASDFRSSTQPGQEIGPAADRPRPGAGADRYRWTT